MTKEKSITFISPPFAGHLNPILECAGFAHKQGLVVTVITSPHKKAIVENLGYRFQVLRSLSNKRLEHIVNTSKPIGSNPYKLYKQLKISLQLAYDVKEELAALWQNARPDLIVADSVTIVPGMLADTLDIPWITTIATPFAIEAHSGPPCYLGGLSENNHPLYKFRDSIGHKLMHLSKKTLAYSMKKTLKQLGVDTIYRDDGTEAAYSPYAILGCGIMELEFTRDWPKHFQMMGALYQDFGDRIDVPLSDKKPNILVSLGTHLPWAKKQLASDIAWLADARPDLHFIGSFGDKGQSSIIIRENATLFPFVSYQQTLPHIDLAIHHGGAGISNACIYHGKFSVVIPHDYDQFDYAARIKAKGLGEWSKKLKSSQTLYYMDRLLERKGDIGLQQFQTYARAYDSEKIFLDTIEKVMA